MPLEWVEKVAGERMIWSSQVKLLNPWSGTR